ncbi:hypothetical protein JW935_10695 [candidate division KSB1 bacterium]|nr:hypothetical protein [candidate division KSB1 bacterium]
MNSYMWWGKQNPELDILIWLGRTNLQDYIFQNGPVVCIGLGSIRMS